MDPSVRHFSGLSAEQAVADHYMRSGRQIAARRWRGPGGEIDLIVREDDRIVFVEVKKSRSFARAAQRIGQRQIARIFASAESFLAHEPRGLLTEARFDVALVDGQGRIEVIENAFAA